MLKTKVKVGSITNLSEARYCAGMGVDFLSFPVPNVDPKTYQDITGWVAGPKFGIEVGASSNNLDQYSVDFIQCDIDTLDAVSSAAQLVVSLSLSDWESKSEKLEALASQILFLEFVVPTIDAAAESILKAAAKQFDLFIKVSSLADLEEVLQLPITGVSLEGSTEVRAGLKEYPLAEVLERLEED